MITTPYFSDLIIKCKIYNHPKMGNHNKTFLKSTGFSGVEIQSMNNEDLKEKSRNRYYAKKEADFKRILKDRL